MGIKQMDIDGESFRPNKNRFSKGRKMRARSQSRGAPHQAGRQTLAGRANDTRREEEPIKQAPREVQSIRIPPVPGGKTGPPHQKEERRKSDS